MEELYVYEISKFNIYLPKQTDTVVFAQNIKTCKKVLLSKTNNLNFVSGIEGHAPLYRIIMFAEGLKSINVAVNIAVPFYSKSILKKLIYTFPSVYLITNFPTNINTSGMFSILTPNMGGLKCTLDIVKREMRSNVCMNFKIVRIAFVHIFEKSNTYESFIF